MPIPTAAPCHTVPTTEPRTGSPKLALVGSPNGGKTSIFNQPVSYTHLTLPTIYSV